MNWDYRLYCPSPVLPVPWASSTENKPGSKAPTFTYTGLALFLHPSPHGLKMLALFSDWEAL